MPGPRTTRNSGALETQNGAIWRAVDAYNSGVEAQNGGVEGRLADLHLFDEKQVLDPDPHQS
jgi:hypothetical protein